MPLEFINELENKVDKIINSFQETRNENKEKNSRIQQLEKENKNLYNELKSKKGHSLSNKIQLDAAAKNIKEVIAKLETVK